MTFEKSTVLPSAHWPTIVKDKTLWSDGKSIAKINFDLSAQLFTTLSDYDMAFACLVETTKVVPQLATKQTKEHAKIRTHYADEIQHLVEFIKSSDHYKAAYMLAHPPIPQQELQPDNESQTPATDDRVKINGPEETDTIEPLAKVILANNNLTLDKDQVNVLDTYYNAIIKKRYNAFVNNPIVLDNKDKKVLINTQFSNIIHALFATAKKEKKQKTTMEEIKNTKQWIFGFFKRDKRSDDTNTLDPNDIGEYKKSILYQKVLWTIEIKGFFWSKYVILKFVSNGKRLMHQIEWDMVFEAVEKEEINKNIPLVTIDHPNYVQQKMK